MLKRSRFHAAILICWVALLGLFFAMTEIQIEGANGWACALPTWRIEKHWLLDIFWGGRPMTGYHAWVFPFMFLVFHLPHAVSGSFSWRVEARCLGSLMLFWIIEDFLWFVLNPCYGLAKFAPQFIPWHKKWLLGLPTDYLVFTVASFLLNHCIFSCNSQDSLTLITKDLSCETFLLTIAMLSCHSLDAGLRCRRLQGTPGTPSRLHPGNGGEFSKRGCDGVPRPGGAGTGPAGRDDQSR